MASLYYVMRQGSPAYTSQGCGSTLCSPLQYRQLFQQKDPLVIQRTAPRNGVQKIQKLQASSPGEP
jgi:hypothetical protein